MISTRSHDNSYQFEVKIQRSWWSLLCAEEIFTPSFKIYLKNKGKAFKSGTLLCEIVEHDNPSTFAKIDNGNDFNSFNLNYFQCDETKTFSVRVPSRFLKTGAHMFRFVILVARRQGTMRDELLLQLAGLSAEEQKRVVGMAEAAFQQTTLPEDFPIGFDTFHGNSFILEPKFEIWWHDVFKIHSIFKFWPILVLIGSVLVGISSTLIDWSKP